MDGLSRPVGGTWRRKRAADAVHAREARVAIENCIVESLTVYQLVMCKDPELW